MDNTCKKIRESLQDLYDIPFEVSYKDVYKNPVYTIIPENDLEELFEVVITIKQDVRVIVEITPQRYAARMLNEMQNADESKRRIFLEYIRLVQGRAKTDILLNQIPRREEDSDFWREEWKQFRLRTTQILDETNKASDEYLIEWAKIAVGAMMSLLTVERIDEEMNRFLDWFNSDSHNGYVKSAIAHLWFVCIHPFDDGNGRIGRAIADMALSQAENSKMRFFSISHQTILR